jgi:hypothetical protein
MLGMAREASDDSVDWKWDMYTDDWKEDEDE